jgi:hypothetical protein
MFELDGIAQGFEAVDQAAGDMLLVALVEGGGGTNGGGDSASVDRAAQFELELNLMLRGLESFPPTHSAKT